ncbi:MAG: hypothetical protein IPO87_13965 [Flavobacteriales bacterium]|nr:hypothetical protein [Flavobacteriales bacterium]
MRTNPHILTVIAFLLFTMTTLQSAAQQPPRSPGDDVVEVVFTSQMRMDDLNKLKYDMARTGISLQFDNVKFNEAGDLVGLNFRVRDNNGQKGSAGTDDLLNAEKFGFRVDRSKGAKTPFMVGSLEQVTPKE